jgi:Ca2+-transporting ATPase
LKNINTPKLANSSIRLGPLNGQAYQLSPNNIAAQLGTNTKTGLSQFEAKNRLSTYGPNRISAVRETPWWVVLLGQFWSPLVGVLVAAAGLSYWFGEREESWAILAVILLNALIGFIMEWSARRTMRALRDLGSHRAGVYRDGQLMDIDAKELVLGDLITLEAGALVPADARLLQQTNLSIDESILTGESTSVSKASDELSGDLLVSDRRNMVSQGTIVSRGNALALVTATGDDTELGRLVQITGLGETATSPLDQKLARLSHRLIWLTLGITGVVLVLGLYEGNDFYFVTKTAIALAVAAIPEGLPVVATLTLAIGMVRLAHRQVVVKTLSAVETLGQTQILIIDKTGTLTENRLEVSGVSLNSSDHSGNSLPSYTPADETRPPVISATIEMLLNVSILCNNAEVINYEKKVKNGNVGDPLEIALLKYATAQGKNSKAVRDNWPRVREVPFSSESGMMATHHKTIKDNLSGLVCIKGAPGVVLARCDYALAADGQQVNLNAELWRAEAETLAGRGLKVLAFAYREGPADGDDFARGLTLLGLISFWDPPRAGIRQAIDDCQAAGIRVVMATGDHPATARNIGLRTGLIDDDGAEVVTGDELARSQVQGTVNEAPKATIYARVTPEQKLTLLSRFQQAGFVVGMAGDGVNDAPAIRRADIGIAMGEGGSDAAKEAADLILQDNSFIAIVEAIRRGRGIFDNIRLFVVYLLSCNLSELLIIGASFVVDFTTPLLPLQILFLNMITDVFPALALGFTETGEDVLSRPPRTSEEGFLNPTAWREIGTYALVICVVILAGAYLAQGLLDYSTQDNNNLTFYTLLSAQLWHVFSLPNAESSLFNNTVTKNKYVWLAILLCLGLTVVAYAITNVRDMLKLEPITNWLTVIIPLLLGATPVLIIRLLKKVGLL